MPLGLEPKAFDLAYIDGSHVAMDVLTDAVLVWDLSKPGGVIIFDDYDWPGDRNRLEGPAKLAKIAVNAFLAVYAPYIDVIHRDRCYPSGLPGHYKEAHIRRS